MIAFSIGVAGMTAATQRFDASAAQTVSGTGDPVQQTVSQMQSANDFAAAAKVAKVADEMTGALLDMTA